MVKLKDGQQQETEGKLQFHSRLTSMECIFEILQLEVSQLEGSYVVDFLYYIPPDKSTQYHLEVFLCKTWEA